MGKKLETSVNIAILVTCVAVVGTIVQREWTTARTPTAPSLFRPGDTFPAFDGLKPERADRTLAMVIRHDCSYCAESMPFYRQLAERIHAKGTGAFSQLIVVTIDDPQAAAHYVEDNHLDVEGLVTVPPRSRDMLRVPGTPTLVLLGRNRRIERVWVGRLDEAGEQQVQAAVAGIGE